MLGGVRLRGGGGALRVVERDPFAAELQRHARLLLGERVFARLRHLPLFGHLRLRALLEEGGLQPHLLRRRLAHVELVLRRLRRALDHHLLLPRVRARLGEPRVVRIRRLAGGGALALEGDLGMGELGLRVSACACACCSACSAAVALPLPPARPAAAAADTACACRAWSC